MNNSDSGLVMGQQHDQQDSLSPSSSFSHPFPRGRSISQCIRSSSSSRSSVNNSIASDHRIHSSDAHLSHFHKSTNHVRSMRRIASSNDVVPLHHKSSHDALPIRRQSSHDFISINRCSSHDIIPIKRNWSHDVISINRCSSHDNIPIKRNWSHDIIPINRNSSQDVTPINRHSFHDVTSIHNHPAHDVIHNVLSNNASSAPKLLPDHKSSHTSGQSSAASLTDMQDCEIASSNTFTPNRRSCRLPRWIIHLVHAVCLVIIIITDVVTLVLANSFNMNLALRWLTVSIVGLVLSIFVYEVLKVIVLSLIRALTTDTLDLDVYRPALETTLEASELLKPVRAKPLAGFALLRAKDEAMKSARLWKMLRHSVIYTIIIVLVTTLNYAPNSGSDGFRVTKNIENTFLTHSYDAATSRKTFQTINSGTDYWKWCEAIALPRLMADADNGKQDTSELPYLVGLARLRQVRSRPVTCMTGVDPRESCQSNPSWHEDSNNYLQNWEPCLFDECDHSSQEELTSNYSMSADSWKYYSSEAADSLSYWGEVSWYNGGGYLADFPSDINSSQALVDDLKSSNWLDNRTRAVMLEFTEYYSNIHLFVSVVLVAEMPLTGGIVSRSRIQTFQLFDYHSGAASYVLVIEGLALVFAIYLTASLFIEIRRHRCQFFTETVWGFVDILIALLTWTGIILLIFLVVQDTHAFNKYQADKNQFIGFQQSAALQYSWTSVNALLLFLLIILAIRQLRYVKSLAAVSKTLTESFAIVNGVAFMFVIILVMYAHTSYLWYGSIIREFRSFGDSVVAMVAIFRGESPYLRDMAFFDIFFAIFFLATWLSGMLIVFALITATMTGVYKYHRKQVYYHNTVELRDFEMIEHMIKNFKKWLGVTREKPAFRQVKFQGLPSISRSNSFSSTTSSHRTMPFDDDSEALSDGWTIDDVSDVHMEDDMISRAESTWDDLLGKLNEVEQHDDHVDLQLSKMADIIESNTSKEAQEPINEQFHNIVEYCKSIAATDLNPEYSKKGQILQRKHSISFKEGAMLREGPSIELQLYHTPSQENVLSYDSCNDSVLGSEFDTPNSQRKTPSDGEYSNHSSGLVLIESVIDNCEVRDVIHQIPSFHPSPCTLLDARSRSLSSSVMTKRPFTLTSVRRTSITSMPESPADFDDHKTQSETIYGQKTASGRQLSSGRYRCRSMRDERISSPVVKIKQAWIDEDCSASEPHLRPGFMF